jgi:NADPH:quinone reductase-like Zn-dependent oxidoreductase
MKAVTIAGYGGPEVLTVATVPPPVPAEGERLVEVTAIGVNPADVKWRSGMFASFAPLRFPHVLGYDIAGTATDSGTRVAAMLDSFRHGGYARCVAVAADRLAPIPDALPFEIAAAIPTPALSGVQLIETQLDARAGQRVLITGAAGMVGRFAVHAARARGCEIVAAVRADRRDEAIALGAHHVVVLGEERWTGPAIDAVADTVGGAEVAELCASVRKPGRIVTVATTPIPAEQLHVEPRFCAVAPDTDRLARLLVSVAAAEVPVPIAARMKLEEAAEAHRRLEDGRVRGKVILLP